MRTVIARCGALVALAMLGAAGAATERDAVASGGTLTRALGNRDAFAQPAPTLDARELRDFAFGNRLFNTNWVVAPASVDAFDGLGPTFNRVSCSGCHLRDGRGRPPLADEDELLSILVRVSVPGRDPHGGPNPHPVYGDQINDRAIPGVAPEARVRIEWTDRRGSYPDGTAYRLRAPRLRIEEEAFGALGAETMYSLRTAPQVLGMGLLEAVPERDIVARADPEDHDGDGISGRANRVWNPVSGSIELGRFGWKANVASLLQQSAAAAQGDIGLTSRHFPAQNCPPAQTACAAANAGGEPELADRFLEQVVFYLQSLAVPARRGSDSDTSALGARLFEASGCADCHVPTLRTSDSALPTLLAGQTFAPYTDLLLHDMGEGLADGRRDFEADGREWRTPPLWGLGLVPIVNDHALFLHDGRARGLEEAILWHDGEARAARERFVHLSSAEREALIGFIETL